MQRLLITRKNCCLHSAQTSSKEVATVVDNLKIIGEAKRLVKVALISHCYAYNELCTGPLGDVVMSVLDGEFRVAQKLASLEGYFSNEKQETYAQESEITMLLEKES